jgi:hypothetical protein
MKNRKVHLGFSLHPYERWSAYVFCCKEFVKDDGSIQFTDKIEEVTCKRCILSNKKFDEQMKKDGVMTEDGRIKTAEEMGFEQNACAIPLL